MIKSLSHLAGSREVENKARVVRLRNQYLALCVCQLMEFSCRERRQSNIDLSTTVICRGYIPSSLSSAEDRYLHYCHLQRTDTFITVICRGQVPSSLSSAEDKHLHHCHLQRTGTFITVICRGQTHSSLSSVGDRHLHNFHLHSTDTFITFICR